MTVLAATARRGFWRVVLNASGGFRAGGELPAGGCVVVANHVSHADAPSLLAALDARHRPMVAAAADYWFDQPVKALVARGLVGAFPVRRTGGGYRDLAARADALRAGRAVVVFPAGGRRCPDGRFHEGAFRLARDAGVPLVPVRIAGTAALLPPSGRPRRGAVVVEIGRPVTVDEPADAAARVQRELREPLPTPAWAGLRTRLARLATTPAGVALAFGWALAEAVSWPVVTELLIAALVLSGPSRPLRSGIRLAVAATLGSAVGGVLTLLLVRHGVVPAQPLTTPAMHDYAAGRLARDGLGGLWSQPLSGVPYKAYASAAGQLGIAPVRWFMTSLQVRCVRLVVVALAAAAIQRMTRRWQQQFNRALAAGLLTFVVSLCLIVSAWQ